MQVTPCANPVCGRSAQVAGYCRPCYMYRRRNKRDRPEEVILESGRRQLERELASPGWAQPAMASYSAELDDQARYGEDTEPFVERSPAPPWRDPTRTFEL